MFAHITHVDFVRARDFERNKRLHEIVLRVVLIRYLNEHSGSSLSETKKGLWEVPL
jgi:hypothetical protein